MAVRMYRGLTERKVEVDTEKVLYVWPIYTGEVLNHVNMNMDICSDATSENSAKIVEFDMYGLSLPLALAGTYDQSSGTSDTLAWPNSEDGWDDRFKDLIFNYDDEGNDYYGGDEREAKTVTDSDLEGETSASDENYADNDLYRGPLGVMRHYSTEKFLSAKFVVDNDEVRFGENWSSKINVGRAGPGFFMLGVRRSDVSNLPDEMAITPQNATHSVAIQRLIGGDVHRNNVQLSRSADALSEKLRELLFGGDQYVEESEAFSNATLSFRMKWMAAYQTPYTEMVKA